MEVSLEDYISQQGSSGGNSHIIPSLVHDSVLVMFSDGLTLELLPKAELHHGLCGLLMLHARQSRSPGSHGIIQAN